MERIAYPRLFSTLAGLLLVVIGLAGFTTAAGFRNPEITADLLGFYPVNGWANTLHLAAGLVGLALARPLPRLYALLAGAVFLGLGLWGVVAPDGQMLLGGLPATRSVNLINLAIGGFGLIALAASRWDRIRNAGAAWFERLHRGVERRRRQRQRRRALKRRRATSPAARRPKSGGRKERPAKRTAADGESGRPKAPDAKPSAAAEESA